MSFPWTRVKKNARISQLLNNPIHHRRRSVGSPLVVETGFPTSIIDLFVKNKERLKRHNKRSKKPSPPSPPPPPPPTPPPMESLDPDESSLLPPTSYQTPMPSASPLLLPSSHRARAMNGATCDRDVEGPVEEGVDGNRVLMAILRIFLVVVLVLGTKKFSVGLTLSAFLLVFLEYVGKHAGRLSGPCSAMKGRLRSIMMRTGSLQEINNQSHQQGVLMGSCSIAMNQRQDQKRSNQIQEIKLSSGCGNQEIECADESIADGMNNYRNTVTEYPGERVQDSMNWCRNEEIELAAKMSEDVESAKLNEEKQEQYVESKKEVLEEEERPCESMKKSRRARMKTKMKKLVPKRLRKKKGQDLENEEISGDPVGKSVDVDPRGDDVEESRHGVDSSSKQPGLDDRKDEHGASYGSDEMNGAKDICESSRGGDQLVQGDSKLTLSREEEVTQCKKNCGYLVLVLLVLVGLIGGRVSALVLTLSWCAIRKLPSLRRPLEQSS